MAKQGSIKHYRQSGATKAPADLPYSEIAVAKDGTVYAGSESNQPVEQAKASHTHDDRYYTETEMNTKLNAKEPAFTKNNAFNKNFGTAAGTVCQGNDSRLSNARRASNITMSLSGTNLSISYS